MVHLTLYSGIAYGLIWLFAWGLIEASHTQHRRAVYGTLFFVIIELVETSFWGPNLLK